MPRMTHNLLEHEDWGRFLGADEPEASPPLPPNERHVIANALDYSVQTIVDDASRTPARLYLDTFQRAYVWDNKKASRLIESLVLNIPLPVCYFAEDPDGRLSIIDGNQRITTLKRFLGNEFSLTGLESTPELNKLRFHQLSSPIQNHICTRGIRCIVIDKRSSARVKFDVFSRLNTAATPLNHQELRNCLQRGPLNNHLHALTRNPDWLRLVGRTKPDKRMRDAELILRFLALTDALDRYERPLHTFLTDWMEQHRNAAADELAELEERFLSAVGFWIGALGEGMAFRRILRPGDSSGRFNVAIFDAQMVGFAKSGGSTRSRQEIEAFTIEATRDDANPFMERVLRGSSHADAMKWRIDHYSTFLAGRND